MPRYYEFEVSLREIDLGAWFGGWRPYGFDISRANAEFDR
jgi:hypothetical protein